MGGANLKVSAGVGAVRPHVVDHTVLHVDARAARHVLTLRQWTVLVAPGRAEARGRALRVVLVARDSRGRREGPSSSIPVVSATPVVVSAPPVVSSAPVVSGTPLETGDACGRGCRETRAARTICGLRHRRRAIALRRSSPPAGLAAASAASVTVEAATASAAATSFWPGQIAERLALGHRRGAFAAGAFLLLATEVRRDVRHLLRLVGWATVWSDSSQGEAKRKVIFCRFHGLITYLAASPPVYGFPCWP